MKIKNRWCRIAWFLEAQREGKFKDDFKYTFEVIPHKMRSTKAMHSMYWRKK
jgi:hypothetical protein